MQRISSTQFAKNPGRYIDLALSEPVTITKHGRETLVMIRPDEYKEFEMLKALRDRQSALAHQLDDNDLELIRRAEMKAGLEYLDEELD